MHKTRTRLTALCAALAAVLAATPAYADTVDVLTYGSAGGTNVTDGDALTAPIKAGTLATFSATPGSTSLIKCADSAFGATVVSNVAAAGTAKESLTLQSFGTCTPVGIPAVSGVQSIVVDNLPYATTVDSAGAVLVTGTAAAPIQTTIKLKSALGTVTCVYRADADLVSGVASNADQSITFTNQKFNRFSGPSACFPNGYFTASYGPVADTSVAGSPLVYVN
ncbi:Tat pathway signal sequence domain protein [Dactylosporangium sp. CA-052675]|uniref:Tat pathway signal sequence domain protein n=1 Tax=Dactylosporangium sp. CA-052675 TaxID=3239927 RepID=UPI003D93A274